MIVLTNQESGAAFQSVTNTVLDHYLKVPVKDWLAAFSEVDRRSKEAAKKVVLRSDGEAGHQFEARPAAQRICGAITGDPWYGDIVIVETAGKLAMSFTHTPRLTGNLEHWQYEDFHSPMERPFARCRRLCDIRAHARRKDSSLADESGFPFHRFQFDFHHLRLIPVTADASPWD